MRDAVPPCEMRYRGEAGTGRRNRPRRLPGRPRHPTRRSRRARLPQRAWRRPERAITADPRTPPPSTAPRITPGRRTRETHSDALATTLRTRRTRPSGPSPQPPRSTSSKPPPNNLPRRHDQNPADFRAAQADPGTGRGRCGSDPACVMRAQRDAVHPASRRASPARHNPPALDSREPASHNASPGDITNSTPPGLAPGSSGAGTRQVPGRVPDSPEQAPGPAGAAGAAGLRAVAVRARHDRGGPCPWRAGPWPSTRHRPHRARRARVPAMALGSTR